MQYHTLSMVALLKAMAAAPSIYLAKNTQLRRLNEARLRNNLLESG